MTTRRGAALTERQARRFSDFRDLVRDSLFDARLDTASSGTFAGNVRVLSCDGTNFVDLSSSAHGMTFTAPSVPGDDGHDFVVCLNFSGETEVRQHGRSMMLTPGDFTVYDLGEGVVEATTITPTLHALNIRMNATDLGLPVEDLQELTCTTIESRDGLPSAVAALLTHFISTSVLTNAASSQPGRRQAVRQAARQSTMLIRTMLMDQLVARGAGSDPTATALQQREAVTMFIDDNLPNPDLSPTTIANAHFISLRQLHRLFENTGETVSSRIRSGRIERCKEDLTDPLKPFTPVGAIGLRWGFRSATQFGSAFKDATGMTPNDFRTAAIDIA
ncbi:helix-turn-helix domain-containing protein [Rhodococcus sp. NPDC057529]|uniref:helix-turn-helix domain-containing protein n=1 Tax=Rhodococcus sp. NPDC057529 TaxID=3346158 RepID=UPI00366C3F5C